MTLRIKVSRYETSMLLGLLNIMDFSIMDDYYHLIHKVNSNYHSIGAAACMILFRYGFSKCMFFYECDFGDDMNIHCDNKLQK